MLGITAIVALFAIGGGKSTGTVTIGPTSANADVPYSESAYYSQSGYGGGGDTGGASGLGDSAACDGGPGGDGCGDGGSK